MPKIFRPFEAAMAFVWEFEGGYSNDPDDPGGATNFGITLATAKANGLDIDGDGDVDVDDIKQMTPEASLAVYKDKYWNPLFNVVSDLPWNVAVVAFDAAVNCGVSRAKKWVADAMKSGNPVKAINNYRRVHYSDIISRNPTLAKYRNGWNRRVNELEKLVDIEERNLKDGVTAIAPFATPN